MKFNRHPIQPIFGSLSLLILVVQSALSQTATANREPEPNFASENRHWDYHIGPFFAKHSTPFQETISIPVLFSLSTDSRLEQKEWDVLYPLLGYDQYGDERRWHLFQLFNFSGGKNIDTENPGTTKRRTVFPFYFHQESTDPDKNYRALFPFYGTVKNSLLRDEVKVVLFPLYVQTKKRDVVTDNYLIPFFHRRQGDELKGWQLWPLVGWETKGLTSKTNIVGDVSPVGGHKKFNLVWPFYFHDRTDLGTEDPKNHRALLPIFSSFTSPQRDSFTAPWPIGLTLTHDREKQYRELGLPWPFVVFARGEGKTVNRVWPFFGQAANPGLASQFYAWPVYRAQQLETDYETIKQKRLGFFFYVDKTETEKKDGSYQRRRDCWPLFTWRNTSAGDRTFQFPAIAEPFFPVNETVPRHYSPLWAIYRSTHVAASDTRTTSLLWNLYRREATKKEVRGSALFGLVRWNKDETGRTVKFLGLRLNRKKGR